MRVFGQVACSKRTNSPLLIATNDQRFPIMEVHINGGLKETEETFPGNVTVEESFPTKRIEVEEQIEIRFLPPLGPKYSQMPDELFQSAIQESGLLESLRNFAAGAKALLDTASVASAPPDSDQALPGTRTSSPEDPTEPSETSETPSKTPGETTTVND